MSVGVDDASIQRMARNIIMDKKGVLRMEHDSFVKAKGAEKGFSTKVLKRAVPALIKNGVQSVLLNAAGKGDGVSGAQGQFTGYYNWARHGFDGPLDGRHRDAVKHFAPKARTVLDLMSTKEGRGYWRKSGTSYVGVLDLSKGSRSLDALTRYTADSVANGKIKVDGGSANEQ